MSEITKQRIAIYGCIFNHDHQLLLVKRSTFDSSPNIWEMPGGSLELGESPAEGVKREVKEETGLEISPLYPIACTTGFSQRDKSKQTVRIAFLAKLTPQEQSIKLSHEHSDYAWVDPFSLNLSPLSDLLTATINLMKKYPILFKLNGENEREELSR